MKTATCVMVSKFESDSYSTSYWRGQWTACTVLAASAKKPPPFFVVHTFKKDPSYTICKSLTFLVDPVLNARFSAKNPRNKKNIRKLI